jgi:hypothetical protein
VGEGGGAARPAASAVSSRGLAARGRLAREKLRGARGEMQGARKMGNRGRALACEVMACTRLLAFKAEVTGRWPAQVDDDRRSRRPRRRARCHGRHRNAVGASFGTGLRHSAVTSRVGAMPL